MVWLYARSRCCVHLFFSLHWTIIQHKCNFLINSILRKPKTYLKIKNLIVINNSLLWYPNDYQGMYPERESNPHSVTRTGFWTYLPTRQVQRVYQFRHPGFLPPSVLFRSQRDFSSFNIRAFLLWKLVCRTNYFARTNKILIQYLFFIIYSFQYLPINN